MCRYVGANCIRPQNANNPYLINIPRETFFYSQSKPRCVALQPSRRRTATNVESWRARPRNICGGRTCPVSKGQAMPPHILRGHSQINILKIYRKLFLNGDDHLWIIVSSDNRRLTLGGVLLDIVANEIKELLKHYRLIFVVVCFSF